MCESVILNVRLRDRYAHCPRSSLSHQMATRQVALMKQRNANSSLLQCTISYLNVVLFTLSEAIDKFCVSEHDAQTDQQVFRNG